MDVFIVSKVVFNSGVLLWDLVLVGMGIVLWFFYLLGDDLCCGKLVQVLFGFDMGQVVILMVYLSCWLLLVKVCSFVDFISVCFLYLEIDFWLI